MSVDVLGHLTSTVGLVCTKNDAGVNVMAAEWSYFVAQNPLHVAISIADYNWTHKRIKDAGEFSITLCDTSQAAVVMFAGSVSGLEIDKTSSADLELAPPEVISTPHVRGGVFNAECRIRHVIDLPGYALIVGEAVWTHHDPGASAHPLVKHGAIHELGPVVVDRRVIVAAGLNDSEATLRVAATAYDALPGTPWEIEIRDDSDGMTVLQELCPADEALLLVDLELPPSAQVRALVVEVGRGGARPGIARPRCSATVKAA